MSLGLWKQFEGETIDRKYRLLHLLGAGGFGGVFLADHIVGGQTLRQVAVKLFAPEESSASRQMQELIGGTALDHPHLLRCFDAGQTTLNRVDLLYLVMEVASQSLAQTLAQRRLSEDETRTLLEQIVPALAFLHRKNLVHRDLKPGNILRVGDNWKLADFGLLHTIDAGATAHTQSLIGSAPYLPPEAFQGVVSPAWDMWSLGIVLVEVLTGQRPSIGDTEVTRRTRPGDMRVPDWAPNLSEPFRAIARGCLRADRHERITAVEVEHLLQPPAAPQAIVRRASKAPWVLLALLLAAAGGIYAFLSLPKRAPSTEVVAVPKPQQPAPHRPVQRERPPAAVTPPAPAPAPVAPPPQVQAPALTADDKDEIGQLFNRWVRSVRDKNVDAHVACYAPVVSVYFLHRNVSLADVRRTTEQSFQQYPNVDWFEISNVRFESFNGTTAIFTLDKEWDMSGERRFAGKERERLSLVKVGRAWKISGEQELKIYKLVK